jgi:hypothetical protein
MPAARRQRTALHQTLTVQTLDDLAYRLAVRSIECHLDLGQERLNVPLRWLDQDLAIGEASHRLAQEVEAVLDMRDPGLLVGELEPPLS